MVNQTKITSGDYSASVLHFGAELCSLKQEPTGTEFIWQADKEVWPRHAPVLFPFVGRNKNFEYRYNNQSYTIEQHGFARDMMFEVLNQSDNTVELELKDNDYTWKRYPFHFSFKVKYTLEQNKLTMGFEVVNKGNNTMPASFGGHPAFSISEPKDAIIEFGSDTNPHSWMLDGNFISNNTRAVTDGKGKIEVDEKTFAGDALIFKHLNSRWVKLQSRSTGYTVKVSLEDWPYLGIWAKPAANFICIEPWQGIADAYDFEGDVAEKEGIIMLPGLSGIKKSFDIEVSL